MIVVISYRTDCRFVHHGDIYPSHENGSDLSMSAVQNEGMAALFIATRLFEEPRTRYMHLIVTSFEGLVELADQLPSPSNAEDPYAVGRVWNRNGQTIVPALPRIDGEGPDSERLSRINLETEAMTDRIRAEVDRLLAAGPPGSTGKPFTYVDKDDEGNESRGVGMAMVVGGEPHTGVVTVAKIEPGKALPNCDECDDTGVVGPPGGCGGYDDRTECACVRPGGVNYQRPEGPR